MANEKQKVCPICNEKLTFLKSTLKDGIKVCAKHVVTEAGLLLKETIEQSTVEDIRKRIELLKTTQEEFKNEVDNFVIAKQIGNFVAFDEVQQKWATLNSWSTFNYSDIVDFELLEDGESIATGGLGRALVGGALFGGVGAIVGGVTGKRKSKDVCSSLRLKVTINDMNNPVVYINFIETKTKKEGLTYKTIEGAAQECLSVFQLICDKQKDNKKETITPPISVADELLKFKGLLDLEAITQDEYDVKKKELLGL
ncbi:hypothetical protein [Sporosarcina psychrophila]|uniref:hypothetical protein n=1 Tax=Sporosarcina psychrophila TaxID=1476 RepID=UPI00078C86A3|nr:hypothetical protein [Sporosarcina psychrophila]AMQ06784.1 hypothetical protein AZE41_13030 [Sporosarcina psychrophila]